MHNVNQLTTIRTLQPIAPETIPYLDQSEPSELPLQKPTSKDWKSRNQKDYFEGRGRFERVSSKVLLRQSANTPLSKKKTSTVPKLIKARRMDVFIPSTLTVAVLAKILNVKLGT